MMPSANTDSFSSAPPLSRLTSWNTPAPPGFVVLAAAFRQKLTFFSEMPGVGRDAPSRNMAMMKSVNSSFLRRSGVRNALMNPVSMRRPHVERSTSAAPGCGARPDGSRARECTPKSNLRSALRKPGASPPPPAARAAGTGPAAAAVAVISQLGDRSARGGDLLPRGRGERVRGHPQLRCRVAGAKYLDELTGAHRAPGNEVVGSDVAALGVQRGQPAGVDYLVSGLEARVGEAAQLGQPAVQWHLAALEPGSHLVACLGALGPAARGLALRCLAAAHPGPRGARSGRRAQVVDLQPATLRGSGAPVFLSTAGVCHLSRPPRR